MVLLNSHNWNEISIIYIPIIAICLAITIFLYVVLWYIYVKAGRRGWECLIPIYNTIILLKIVGKSWWWLLLMLIPIAGIIWSVWMYNMLSKSFGKDEAFTVGLVLLGIVFLPILGFGSAKYLGPYGDKETFANYHKKLDTETLDSN